MGKPCEQNATDTRDTRDTPTHLGGNGVGSSVPALNDMMPTVQGGNMAFVRLCRIGLSLQMFGVYASGWENIIC